MLSSTIRLVILDVKVRFMIFFLMPNSRLHGLQSMRGARTATMDITPQILGLQISTFQTINISFLSFLLVIMVHQELPMSPHQERQRTCCPLVLATTGVLAHLPHKDPPWTGESNRIWSLPEKEFVLREQRKPRPPLVPVVQQEHTATLARCTWS